MQQDYVKLARVEEFGPGDLRGFSVLARLIGVIREADGGFRAMEMRCKHQGADLSSAPREGWRVTCPRHGGEYDLRSGECLNAGSPPLRPHGLKVEGGWIRVTPTPLEPEPDAQDAFDFPVPVFKSDR